MDGGIYGGLNKIGTIQYFLTLSVSQVLFPRVVEACEGAARAILLSSAGSCRRLVGAILRVLAGRARIGRGILFGPAFRDATLLRFRRGPSGSRSRSTTCCAVFMAVHDRVFVPILAFGCRMEACDFSFPMRGSARSCSTC